MPGIIKRGRAGDRLDVFLLVMAKKRIFVRGLPKETTEESLISRFESFGAVSDVSIARDGFVEKGCRGFGHLTIDIDDGSWKKCMSLLNGSKWKGQTIHISEARPSHTERTANIAVDIPTEKPLRRLVRHAADMTLVNDNDSKIRKVCQSLFVRISFYICQL